MTLTTGIAEIVHPTQFRSSYHKVAVNLAYTFSWVSKRQRQYIKAYELTWEEFSILSILREHFPYTTGRGTISARISHIIINPYTSLEKLKKRKLVEHYSKALYKKDRGYLITKEGLCLLTRIDKRISNLDKIMTHISPEEAERLSVLLDKVRG